MRVTCEETQYRHFGACVRLSNEACELLVMVGQGPRVIRFALREGENVFAELQEEGFDTGNGFWRMHGGHRLWHSPEAMPRTYTLDREAVSWTRIENGLHTVQNVGPDLMRKEMIISLDADNAQANVVHRIYNMSPWPVEFSVWGVSVMAPGGVMIVPQNRTDSGLLPNRNVVYWPYTDVRDERMRLGNRYALIRQDKGPSPFMYGQPVESGWAGYVVHDTLFVKNFDYQPGASYPDFGCCYEAYCCDFMIECETLSPLGKAAPGDYLEHVERWRLVGGVKAPRDEDEAEGIAGLIRR